MSDQAEGEAMPIRETVKSWGANLNTAVTIVATLLSIGSMLCFGLWVTANRSRDIDDLKAWQVAHDALHKDLKADRAGKDAGNEVRLRAIEDKLQSDEADLKILGIRTAATEQSVGSVVSSIKELTSSVNQLSGDVRVVREIVQRQDGRVTH